MLWIIYIAGYLYIYLLLYKQKIVFSYTKILYTINYILFLYRDTEYRTKYYMHTTDLSMRNERQKQMAQLDEKIRRNEAVMLKRQRDSRMQTELAIRELRLEQERRLIKEKQRLQEHEARRRARRQNREQLERKLERIKNEL